MTITENNNKLVLTRPHFQYIIMQTIELFLSIITYTIYHYNISFIVRRANKCGLEKYLIKGRHIGKTIGTYVYELITFATNDYDDEDDDNIVKQKSIVEIL